MSNLIPTIIVFILVAGICAINLMNVRRRAAMTNDERAAEDEEIRDLSSEGW